MQKWLIIPFVLFLLYKYARHALKSIHLGSGYELNISRRFKQLQQEAQITTSHFLEQLTLDEIDLDLYLASLGQFKHNEKVLIHGQYMDKMAAWHDFQHTCLQKLFLKLYCSSALIVQLNVQLNILGKYAYLQSVSALQEGHAHFLSDSDRHAFLELTKYLFEQGYKHLNVETVTKSLQVALDTPCSIKDIQGLLKQVRHHIEEVQGYDVFRDVLLPTHVDSALGKELVDAMNKSLCLT